MVVYRCTLILFSFCFAFGLNAQEALSLDNALEKALANRYQIQIAREEANIADIQNDWGEAGRLPAVNLSVTNNNNFNKQNNPASFFTEATSVSTGLNSQLDVSWTIYNGSRVTFQKDQLEKSSELSQNNTRQVIEVTVAEVINAYHTAQIQSEQLEVLRELLVLSADQLDYVNVQQEYGQAVRFDVIQARDAYLNDSSNYSMQLTSYNNSLYNLNRSMGIEQINRNYILTDSLDRTVRSYNLQDLYEQAQRNNIRLENNRLMLEMAVLNTQLAEATQYPNVGLNSGATYNTNVSNTDATFADGNMRNFDGAKSNTFNAYLNLSASLNIYNGGTAKRAVETARLEELIAQKQILSQKLDIKQGLSIALENYRQFKKLYGISRELAENAALNLQLSGDRFRNGLINSFDYRTVQLSYLNARLQELNHLYNLRLSEVDLQQLSGQLVEKN